MKALIQAHGNDFESRPILDIAIVDVIMCPKVLVKILRGKMSQEQERQIKT